MKAICKSQCSWLRQYDDVTIFVLLSIGFLSTYLFRHFEYFRDYAVMYDGAYRISRGDFPYKAFGMPVGPVSLLLPAALFTIMGPAWVNVITAQQIVNVAQLGVFTLILRRLSIRKSQRHLAMVTYSFLYLLTLSHSWYNNTAALLFSLCVFLSLSPKITSRLLCGVCLGLCIFCKQDYGALSVLVSAVLSYVRLNTDPFFSQHNLWYRVRRYMLCTYPIMLTMIVVAVLFVALLGYSEFSYWFNYGQSYQTHRRLDLKSLVSNCQFVFFVIGTANFIRTKHMSDAVCFLVLATSCVVSQTSGLPHTSNFFVGYIPVIIASIRWPSPKLRVYFVAAAALLSMYLLKQQIKNVFNVGRNIALGLPEPYHFYGLSRRRLVGIPTSYGRFGSNNDVPDGTLALIQWLRSTYSGRGISNPVYVLNMSELSPLTSDAAFRFPKGLPLWFHTGVTLFPREVDIIERDINAGTYELIIFQGVHEMSPTLQRLVSLLNKSSVYTKIAVYASPSANDYGSDDFNISVFVRK